MFQHTTIVDVAVVPIPCPIGVSDIAPRLFPSPVLGVSAVVGREFVVRKIFWIISERMFVRCLWTPRLASFSINCRRLCSHIGLGWLAIYTLLDWGNTNTNKSQSKAELKSNVKYKVLFYLKETKTGIYPKLAIDLRFRRMYLAG